MIKLITGKELANNGAKCGADFTVLVESTKKDVNGNSQYLITLFFKTHQVFQKVKGIKNTKEYKYKIQAYNNELDEKIVNLINSISDDDSVMLDFAENL